MRALSLLRLFSTRSDKLIAVIVLWLGGWSLGGALLIGAMH